MSECVVRMEMPKGCGSCPIANFGYCSINHEQVGDPLMGYPENRPASCPIICPLPERHGRLVEAKALFERVYEYYGQDNESNENWMMEMINGAPTIVPAERSET